MRGLAMRLCLARCSPEVRLIRYALGERQVRDSFGHRAHKIGDVPRAVEAYDRSRLCVEPGFVLHATALLQAGAVVGGSPAHEVQMNCGHVSAGIDTAAKARLLAASKSSQARFAVEVQKHDQLDKPAPAPPTSR